MEIQQIAAADWLDLLFDGRNKEYGAYDLRRNYNRRLVKSIAIMTSVCLLFVGGCTLVGKLRGTDSIQQMVTPEIILSDVPEKKSGKWSPAIQNGRMVKSYKRQPIILQL